MVGNGSGRDRRFISAWTMLKEDLYIDGRETRSGRSLQLVITRIVQLTRDDQLNKDNTVKVRLARE